MEENDNLLMGLIAIDYEPIEAFYPQSQKKAVSLIGEQILPKIKKADHKATLSETKFIFN
jgi:hypothetical protein